MNTKLAITTIFAAGAFVPAANAQWADGGWAYAARDSAPAVVVVVPQVQTPVTEDTHSTEEAVRPVVPCNPYRGCNLAPGQVVIAPHRPARPCNPYDLADPCNAGKVPPGGIVVNPPRPAIPCSAVRPDHCV